ncbi:MAG: 3-oxoacyl-ACP synthase III [Planctomycetota bacterium]
MRYSRVFIDAIGYELAPVVVTSEELEERVAPVYAKLHLQPGQLEALTGIQERRWWEPGTPLARGATTAAERALARTAVRPEDLEVLIYAGVCRESYEPATACRVAHGVGVSPNATLFDLSNACLGVLNGIVEVANRIELGQIRAGLVCSCESAREIVDEIIAQMLANPTMPFFTRSLATLTGGSGAVAVVLTDGSFTAPGSPRGHRLLGGVACTEPRFHDLCRWGVDLSGGGPHHYMYTDSIAVLNHGVALGIRTWRALLEELDWDPNDVDRLICHQVGAAHIETILRALAIPMEKDYRTFPFLGNMGTVSLPVTAAIASERGALEPGERAAFLGIGSGLNCLMLGVEW